MQNSQKKRALISVSDKTYLNEFATALHKLDIEIIATGNSAKLIRKQGIPVTEVADYTGFPEIMDGRVKTLHPRIHGGLLARRGIDDHWLDDHKIPTIDIVAVNLYPFQETIAKPGTSLADAIEKIDIGGPTMLRAAAKNHEYVTVAVDPHDYIKIIEEFQQDGDTTLSTRRALAYKTFAHTAQYDAAIQAYFAKQLVAKDNPQQGDGFPETLTKSYNKIQTLRYGENPHQRAAVYREQQPQPGSIASATLLQGKPLSYNNMVDADATLNCAKGLNPNKPGCVIVKHATPCGVAQADTLIEAYNKAYRCDSSSAFGGIIAVNQELDAETTAKIIGQQFVEVIIAPSISAEAQALIASKKNCRVLLCEQWNNDSPQQVLRSISGGLLIQDQDINLIDPNQWTIASKRQPTDKDMDNLIFAWRVVQFVKSNAIVYTADEATLGIGTGQTSRVFSAEIAALKAQAAELSLDGAAMGSDAFFPFADGVEIAAAAGISAIIQPGGSKRDEEVIAAADRLNLIMVMTGQRHFLH